MLDRWPAAMKLKTVAAYLDCSESQAAKILSESGVPAVQLTLRGDRKWLRADIDAFLDRQKDQPVRSPRSA